MSRFASIVVAAALALSGGLASGQTANQTGRAKGDAAGRPLEPAPAAYVTEVTGAARAFFATLTEAQRETVLAPFYGPKHTSGRDTTYTPAFCAVLAWCVGWGLPQCSLTFPQRRALTRLLAAALSDSGYQTVRAILNGHRLIGELERVADSDFVGKVAEQCPGLGADGVFEIPARCLPDGEAMPDYAVVGGAEPLDNKGNYRVLWRWPDDPPGFEGRYRQFCEQSIAFFGKPGSDQWAFRFEGHHLTVNLTFERDAASGRYRVAATPLFLGSFPMIVPPSPAPDDTELALTWERSQELMRETAEHARRFITALPAAARQAGFVPGDRFPQTAPLRLGHFPNWMLSSTLPDAATPLPVKPAILSTADLDDGARWQLRSLFRRYFDTMHPAIGDQYRHRFDAFLADRIRLFVLWAGAPDLPDGHFFLHVTLGSLLLELNASNEWSTQHRAVPKANHLHSMFRDLSFRWDYDASRRPDADHHHKNHQQKTSDTNQK